MIHHRAKTPAPIPARTLAQAPALTRVLDPAPTLEPVPAPVQAPALAVAIPAPAQALAQALAQAPTPALVLASIVHADLVTVAPFASHNGIVARAAERLVLVARGVDPTSLVVPEAGHLALREAYESNLRGYASGQRSGIHSWLLYAAEAFSAGAEASPLRREA